MYRGLQSCRCQTFNVEYQDISLYIQLVAVITAL